MGIAVLLMFSELARAVEDSEKQLRGSHQGSWQPSRTSESVNCSLDDSSSLLLLTSSGLGAYAGDSLVPDWNTMNAFRDLVLQLPDSAWDADGAVKKGTAQKEDISRIAARNFTEPGLYSGLTVVVLEDTCFLKESFWNELDPNFDLSIGINYQTTRMRTPVDLIRPFFGKGLDDGWCVNYSSTSPGYLGSLGFDSDKIHHVSLFDQLASNAVKEAVLNLSVQGLAPNSSTISEVEVTRTDAADMLSLLGAADVMIVNGGSPDFAKFVFMHFASAVLQPAIHKIKAGRMIYLGQSAGAMIGAADIGLTYASPNPNIFKMLLSKDSRGLRLAGNCAIRPHDTGLSASRYDLASAVYGKLKGLNVARLSNGEGLKCIGTTCRVVGGDGQLGDSVFEGQSDPHLERLTDAFQSTSSP